jgi:hypothetical protein
LRVNLSNFPCRLEPARLHLLGALQIERT